VAPVLLLFGGAGAAGQEEGEPLRIEGLYPSGVRTSVTDTWTTLRFTVENRGDAARQARVVAFYPGQPDLRFARDLWVPGHARRTAWLSIGPAPEQPSANGRELAFQLLDRTDGADRLVRGPHPERLSTRAVLYAPREPTTAIYADEPPPEDTDQARIAEEPEQPDAEIVRLAQVVRDLRGLSERVLLVTERFLPPVADAFDGVDHFVLASNRLAADPPGRQALRHWVEGGGTLWVLLDRVDPEVVAPLLGDGPRFRLVDRTSLTTLHLRGVRTDRATADVYRFDRPVDLARVELAGPETPLMLANDWPAAFSRPLGRGRVVFTTLGARGWYRPRARTGKSPDPPSRFAAVPDLPVAQAGFYAIAQRIHPDREEGGLDAADLAPVLTAEVGYAVVGRPTAAVVLAGFVVGLVAVAVALRRTRAPEAIGLGAPAVALAAAAAFVAAGASARHAVPPTAAAVAVVSVAPDSREEHWQGLFAVYNPGSGAVRISAVNGGWVDIDQSGLAGTTRVRAETDLGAWHWENLALPAGTRTGPLRATTRVGVSAVARFGPAGLDGRLTSGAFKNPADAVLQTRAGAVLAVRWDPDGGFHVASDDVLPPEQYLRGAVLTDRQQRRQEVYRRILGPAKTPPEEDRLFVWTDADELPVEVADAARTVGQALLVVPLRYEVVADGTGTVPFGFAPYLALTDGRLFPPTLENSAPTRMRLRFQLPDQIRTVERAVLTARVRAPLRKFAVFGVAGDRAVPVREQLGPAGPVRVELTAPELLRTDPTGGVYVELAVGERIGSDGREDPVGIREQPLRWQIESLGLEVVGRGPGR
jgi:hypothetical protein